MKRLYKYASGVILTAMFSVAVATTASAQHGGGHGGGGVSIRGGGGGGVFARSIGGGFGAAFRTGGLFRSGVTARSLAFRGAVSYNRGGFFRPGFGYYGYPHIGFYLGVLPFGYYPFYWGDDLYYYSSGVFYRPYDGGGYEVTTPPVGAAVPSLPQGARSIKIDGQQFYELNGVYYKAVVNDAGKQVYVIAGRDGVLNTDGNAAADEAAAPKVGDIVNELPDGCRKVSLNGKKYYVSPNDIYYQTYVDENGNSGYRIASIPTEEEQDN